MVQTAGPAVNVGEHRRNGGLRKPSLRLALTRTALHTRTEDAKERKIAGTPMLTLPVLRGAVWGVAERLKFR
jgi:hypothetical protein